MSEPAFPVSLQLRLDWSELDLYGHINNVQFFKYLQASRVNYWEHMGMDFNNMPAGIGPLLASTHCDFRKPLYYPGRITVLASVTEMRRTSFRMDHRILDGEGALAAEGRDVIVLFNYGKGEKEPVPQSLRAIVEQLEGRLFPADT
jgi:acyl-CoA thioester hydrolase